MNNKCKAEDINWGGKREGAGRPPKASTTIKNFLKDHPNAYDKLMQVLYDKALSGDLVAAQYVIDRLKGRPHQSIDQRTRVQIDINKDEDTKAIAEARAYEAEVLRIGTTESKSSDL